MKIFLTIFCMKIINSVYCNYASFNTNPKNLKYFMLKDHITSNQQYASSPVKSFAECIGLCNEDRKCKLSTYKVGKCYMKDKVIAETVYSKDKIILSKQNFLCSEMCSSSKDEFLCGDCECVNLCQSKVPYYCNCTKVSNGKTFDGCDEALSENKNQTGVYKIKLSNGDEGKFMCQLRKEEKSCNLISGKTSDGSSSIVHSTKSAEICIHNCEIYGYEHQGGVAYAYNHPSKDCYCKRQFIDKTEKGVEQGFCRFGFTNKVLTWVMILELIDRPLYFEDKTKYETQVGYIGSGRYWVGLENLYLLLDSYKSWTLRVEYNVKGKFDRIIVEYQDFKIRSRNNNYELSYSQYRPIRTYPENTDVLKCSRHQPFKNANGQTVWGNPLSDSVPFHSSKLHWHPHEASWLRMSIRKKMICEEILGEYEDQMIYVVEQQFVGYYYRQDINKKFYITEYEEVTLGEVTCTGKITFPFHSNEKIVFEYKKDKSEFHFLNDKEDPYEKDKWKKLTRENHIKKYNDCDDIKKLGCPEVSYKMKDGSTEDCD